MMRALLLSFLVMLAFVPATAQDRQFSVVGLQPGDASYGERILAFDSDVTIHTDSSMTVVETIRIRSEGNSIKRGIIREFPTTYKDDRGDTVEVDFNLVSVTRDGQKEPYQVDAVSNGLEIRIGDPDVTLRDGEHTYVITYKTAYQLGYFPEGDELYWNVTGTGWVFPIDLATATIRLPQGGKATRMAVYTGRQGSTDQNATIAEEQPGIVKARTNRPLGSYEGLTVIVQFPKGLVQEPGGASLFWRWLTSNLAALIGLVGALLAGLYMYSSWKKWGKDPERGTIIPLFEPPGRMEPAEARFLAEMGFDNKIFAAAIMNMAVKGAVTIEEDPGWFNKTFKLVRTGQGAEALSPIERAAYDQLFMLGDDIELKQANWQRIKAASEAMKSGLQIAHTGKSFHENTGTIAMGLGILALAGVGVWLTANDGLATWIGGGALVLGAIAVFALIQIMKAPTVAGQALRDQIDGFRMFLDTAEKERWEVLNPPDMTPQIYEKYLPFALALDVDHTWSETFEREMRIKEPNTDYNYRPRWYSGRNFSGIGAGALSNSIATAMTSAIASSSSPPGKKSGFSSGGGFSGGGGGGGGGRGW